MLPTTREDPGAVRTMLCCQAFRDTGECRFGAACHFSHGNSGPVVVRRSWQVSGLPRDITDADTREIALAFSAAMQLGTDGGDCAYLAELYARGANRESPYAFIKQTSLSAVAADDNTDDSDATALRCGMIIRDKTCTVKRRHDRRRDAAGAPAKPPAAASSASGWHPRMLLSFPRRESTLDLHTMVEMLPQTLTDQVEAYLAQKERATACPGLASALRWVWTHHPRCLRVKELFETVEAFAVLVSQLKRLKARSAKLVVATAAAASSASSAVQPDDYVASALAGLTCRHGPLVFSLPGLPSTLLLLSCP